MERIIEDTKPWLQGNLSGYNHIEIRRKGKKTTVNNVQHVMHAPLSFTV